MPVAHKQEYIRLRWSEHDRKIVLVEDSDEERFCMTVDEAIEACKVQDRQKRASFRKQFSTLLDFLGNWSYERRNKLFRVLLTIRDVGLLFLVVTKRKTYDELFEEQLTELDLQVANSDEFSEIHLSVQALPLCNEDNYSSFCNPEWTLEYTGLHAE